MSEKVKGVAPGFLLLPAREYDWELDRRIEIRVPNGGSISELLNNRQMSEGLTFPGDDEFYLFDKNDNVLLLWEIVKVLFAAAKYPHLENDQCLNVVALVLEGNEIVLHGEIIRSV